MNSEEASAESGQKQGVTWWDASGMLAIAAAILVPALLPVIVAGTARAEDYAWVGKFDPPLGTSLPIDLKTPTPVLLVLLGDCQACSVQSFDPRNVSAPGRFSVVLVANGKNAKIPSKLQDPVFDVRAEDGSVSRALNAAWHPRWYWFDEGGKLRDLQREPRDLGVDLR